MAWRCELTGKTRQIGHRVSHSNRKTKRRFLPNLLNVTLMSDALGRSIRLRISANALKTVDHRGGLDAFLLKAKDAELSPRVLELKRQVVKKRAARRRRLGSRSCSLARDALLRAAAPAHRPRPEFSSNSSASFSVMTPPSSSASTMVTARR